jgi:hypothetical protein
MILRHPADTRGNFFSSACADRNDNIHPVPGYFFLVADMEDKMGNTAYFSDSRQVLYHFIGNRSADMERKALDPLL